MQLEKVGIILRREYSTRVKTKAFWISTVTVPLLMAAMLALPAIFLAKTESTHHLVVVDVTGRLATPLVDELGKKPQQTEEKLRRSSGPISFEIKAEAPAADLDAQRADLDRRLLAGEMDAWLWIPADGLQTGKAEYHSESVSNFLTQEILAKSLTREARRQRFSDAGLDVTKVDELSKEFDLATIRVTKEGGRKEQGMLGFMFAYLLFFLLYMLIVIYGQQVMNGVLEEKSSRSMEVLISSVRPFDLLLGKLVGICLVGLTQLVIWLGTLVALTSGMVIPAASMLPEGMSLPQASPFMLINFLLCFLLGFFLYASVYAAIGACFNNVQEAQQFAGYAVLVLFVPLVLLMPVINDPDSRLAVVSSLVPLFTPLLMLLRVVVKSPPVWQLLLGYSLTFLTVLGIVWFSARIYRIGILMYGKKPTFQEIWRWVRYA